MEQSTTNNRNNNSTIHGSAPRKRISHHTSNGSSNSRIISSEDNSDKILDVSELKQILSHWSRTKEKISKYQKEADECKAEIEKYMDVNDINEVENIKRRRVVRESVSKRDVPEDVWNMYCKKVKYWTYTFIKNKIE